MGNPTIVLTDEQMQDIKVQEGGGGIPVPEDPVLMEIDFDEIWPEREVEPPRSYYMDTRFICTDVDGFSIACKMPDVINRAFKFRIVDIQIPETPYARMVVWSERRDFTEPYLAQGTGGTSANGTLQVTPDMAGKTYYYNGRLNSGTPEAPYTVFVESYAY